jgi:hypothetical protein|tara:strand:+ start:498 stop:737 length:240 start_codon:yes stop_codon:yes gene_type:complete
MVNDMLDVVLLSSLLCCSSFSYQISSSTGTGPKRVYQFKLIEKEPWGNEPKQLCKLGSTDLRVIKFLRTTIAERVASKY